MLTAVLVAGLLAGAYALKRRRSQAALQHVVPGRLVMAAGLARSLRRSHLVR
jgi:hypothetical protein